MNQITITLPLPNPMLSPNARVHRIVKARITKKHRTDAGWAAIEALHRRPGPQWKRAEITAVWFRRTDLPQHSIDQDNATAWLKSYVDGLQGSILENDRGLQWAPHEFRLDKADPRIELTIRSLDDLKERLET